MSRSMISRTVGLANRFKHSSSSSWRAVGLAPRLSHASPSSWGAMTSQHRCAPVARKLPVPEMTPGVSYTASGDSLEDYPGWYVFRRGTDGRMYYYNVDYEITQWEHPRDKPHTDTKVSYSDKPSENLQNKVRPPSELTTKAKLVKGALYMFGGFFCMMAFGGAPLIGRISMWLNGGHRVNTLKPVPKGGYMTEK
eukprot:gnl/MRDRNA2_/MRDRNA2_27924_c0_seq1.p1 gnl/MRDRNA2_/MRDRNA2_27924_c0~~gnl/MRDRNA2_/MRDRNA2_27924_c0_seq1.p1  ORF type:complete len:195 (+),score=28.35 gnl/MRDRNA2_/MRDRNA2_27924_c0_seq1:75-659(+)